MIKFKVLTETAQIDTKYNLFSRSKEIPIDKFLDMYIYKIIRNSNSIMRFVNSVLKEIKPDNEDAGSLRFVGGSLKYSQSENSLQNLFTSILEPIKRVRRSFYAAVKLKKPSDSAKIKAIQQKSRQQINEKAAEIVKRTRSQLKEIIDELIENISDFDEHFTKESGQYISNETYIKNSKDKNVRLKIPIKQFERFIGNTFELIESLKEIALYDKEKTESEPGFARRTINKVLSNPTLLKALMAGSLMVAGVGLNRNAE